MTLKDLSRRLGLSPTTVSRALNGYPEVAEATRKRVHATARAMNYAPNARAQGLATGRARAIGHVMPVSARHEMVNPIFGDFITGAGEVYTREGYEMLLSVVDDADQPAVYRRMVARGSVDGVVVHGPRMADPRIDLLCDLGLPFVVHGRASTVTRAYNWLDTDNARSFARATNMLLDLGHRRIALINGLEFMDFAHRRRTAYEDALSARGIAPDPALMRSDEMTEGYGFDAAAALMAAPAPPTAFLVSSMTAAIGVRRALHDRDLRLGRDVSVITHDDDLSYLKNGAEAPVFTAMRSSVRHAGRRAAEILLARIADPTLPPAAEMLPTELVIGTTTGPAPQAMAHTE